MIDIKQFIPMTMNPRTFIIPSRKGTRLMTFVKLSFLQMYTNPKRLERMASVQSTRKRHFDLREKWNISTSRFPYVVSKFSFENMSSVINDVR